jgi:RHS repeat-associated protein
MRLFRLIVVLIAILVPCLTRAEMADSLEELGGSGSGGWTTYHGVHDSDPTTAHIGYEKFPEDACYVSAEQEMDTEELGTEARKRPNWKTRDCWYWHFLLVGGYDDRFVSQFECPDGREAAYPGICAFTHAIIEERAEELPGGEELPGTEVTSGDPAGTPEPVSANGDPCTASVGNPIMISSGVKFENVVDFSTGGSTPLEFRRYYRSLMSSPFGHVGVGWSSTYDRQLLLQSSTSIDIYTETGATQKFAKSGGLWNRSYSDMTGHLVEVTSGTVFEFTNGSDRTDRFELVNGAFRLTQVRWRNGYHQDLAYVNGKLSTVTDGFGRTLTFTWDLDVIASVEAPGQYEINYSYGGKGASGNARGNEVLTKVRRQNLASGGTEETSYLYEDANHKHLLTGIVDGNGNRYATYEYDPYGRGVATEHAGGAGRYEIEYDDDNLTRTVTNPLGKQAIYHFTKRQDTFKLDTVDGQSSTNCPAASSAFTYDTNGFVSSYVDWNGNVTTYLRDARGLETSRTEAVGEPEERTTTTTWHSTFRVPTQIVMPGLRVDLTYDTQGRLTQWTATDTTSHSVPYSTNGQTRTVTYTWNTDGELTSVDGPRTDVSDVTTYNYDGSGNLISVTNALSHETQVTSSNVRNQPLSITDPNGVATDLAYDVHGRLIKRTIHPTGRDEVMEMAYDAAGQVISVTSPDGSRLEYEYDDAHRLTAIKNGLGERIELTLNAMGNRTQTKIKSSTGAILKTQTRVYDELGRLLQSVGASSQATSFEYDDNGNMVEVTDPRSAATGNAFDGLDRLVQSTDALTGVTEYGYDAQDNVVSVEDAKNQVTSFVYNGFGDAIQLASPDTGISIYEVDKAGNRTKETDARGVVANYTYDALDRLTAVAYPASTAENVAFTYDDTTGGNKGVGQLTGVTDENGSASYVYDGQGRLTQETRVIGAVGYTTIYGYDAAGNLQTITYPTGRVVTYQRDTVGRVNTVLSQASSSAPPALIAGNISYLPFGPVQSLTFGNGVVATYEYDQDYRLTGIASSKGSTGIQDLTLTHDGADNITAITDALDATRSQTFEYDLLGRLTDAAGYYGTEEYTYDTVGNRLTRTLVQGSAINVTYTYVSGNSQLQSASNGSTTRSFTYDDAGNTNSDSVGGGASFSYTYNHANRLKQSQEGGGPTFNYGYDAFGERVIKQAVGQAGTHFRYDPMGHLIHESDDTGNPIRSYIYLGDLPIAQIEPGTAGTPVDVVVDNTDSGASASGNWSTATAGQGYEGVNYSRQTTGAPAGAVVVDNTSPQFAALGNWNGATTPSGFQGSNYLTHNSAGLQLDEIIIDNTDPEFSTIGTWSTGSNISGYYGSDYAGWTGGTLPPSTVVLDNADSGFQAFGPWTTFSDTQQYGTDMRGFSPPNQAAASSVITDNDTTGTSMTGTWSLSNNTSQYGPSWRGSVAGTGGNTYTWTPTLPSEQAYNIYAWWRSVSTRATNAPYTIHHSGGSTTVQVNQKINDARWNLLGTFTMAPGQNHRIVLSNDANGTLAADAIMITPKNELNRAEWTPTLTETGSYYVYGWWRAVSTRATDAPYIVLHSGGTTTVPTNQQVNGGKWNLLGTFQMGPGQAKVTLTDEANGTLVADATRFSPVDGMAAATWQPNIVDRDQYEIFARWTAHSSRTASAPYTIHHEGGSTSVTQNQQQNGGAWVSLGTYILAPGQDHRVVLQDSVNGVLTSGGIIADAIKFVPQNEVSATWSISSIPANGNYKVYAKWPASPVNASDVTYSITHAGGSTPVTVNQKANGRQWNLLGTFSFNSGGSGYKVALSGAGNGQVAADAIYYANDNAVPDSFTWTPTIPSAGDYAVYAKWPTSATDSGTAVYTITHDGGVASQSVSQRTNGGEWVWLGTYAMNPANNPQVTLTAANDGAVYADAVRFVSGDAIGGEIAYSHGDQLGTTQKLTDASGTVIWDRIARPFGETVAINAASGIEQKLRFAGQFADETGLSYNYFRDYDPTLGRYAQSDPIGLAGGINTYAYVAGSPINYTDPTGEIIPQLLIGFVIGAGLEYLTNPCATMGDLLLAGGLGALGGGLSKAVFLRLGARSLTRETGLEWSHGIAKRIVNRNTSGWLKRVLNKRGGLNGSWRTPPSHARHDPSRHWPGVKPMFLPLRALDRIPDWLKGTGLGGGVGAAVAGSDCECR